MPYLLTLFDGGTIPTTLGDGSVTVGPGQAETRYVRLVGGAEWDGLRTDTANVPHVTYTQTSILSGTSQADLKTKADVWHGKVGKAGTLSRVSFDSTGTHTLWSRLTNVQDTVTPMGGLITSLDMTWESAAWPWKGTTRSATATFVGTADTGTANTIALANLGNVPMPQGTLTLSPNGGSITRFDVNAISGASTISWYWAGSIGSGSTIVIDYGAKTILKAGVAAYTLTLGASHNIDGWMWDSSAGVGTATYYITMAQSGGTSTMTLNSWDGWA